jgi:hypothetical protein
MSGQNNDSQQNLAWDLLRITMPALIFVVIFLTLVLVVKMSFWLAGGIAFAVALADYFLFAMLKKRSGSQ